MGAPIVVRLSLRAVQAFVGVALLVAASLYGMTNLGLMPGGGEALALNGGLAATAIAARFVMGACAFLMPVSGLRFMCTERVDLRVVVGMAVGGVPAVLLAAFVVKSLPLQTLRWGVVLVVLYSAALLLRSAARRTPVAAAEALPS